MNPTDAEQASEEKKEEATPDMLQLILKNVTLTVNGIHIRYEDDFYAFKAPFAFGLLCDVLPIS